MSLQCLSAFYDLRILFSVYSPIVCPYLVVRNDTKGGDVYIYPEEVETQLNATSTGTLTVNCTSGGWPPPTISWMVNDVSIYDFPYYNVTENGQVSLWNCMY